MNRQFIFAAAALVSAFPAVASFPSSALLSQDSASSQPQPAAPSREEPKKTKKVWTNDNMAEVSGSAISQVGEEKNSSPGKNATAKPTSSQAVAAYRKQLTTLQAQIVGVDKQIADLKSFSKGEKPGANGMQLHKGYSTEPIEDQLRKLEEKRKGLAAKMDAVLDAARKQGIEPGLLR
jgi:hypothetical protein